MAETFENRLKRLEEISELLRRGTPELEEAGGLFEEGIKLAKGLEKDLSKLERRIEILVKEPTNDQEKPVLELFPELND